MLLGQLIEGLNVRLADPSHAALRICDVSEDSRTVQPGSLYIARKGEAADGNDYIPQAIAAGAVAILSDRPGATLAPDHKHASVALLTSAEVPVAIAHVAERFFGGPSSKLLLVGVTGTNGKTTITYLIHQILNGAGFRTGLVGTVFVDDGTEIAPSNMTTPPALELSRTLARMHEAGCRAAVLEVSSHSLAQDRVGALKFDAAVFTNLTGDHLDYHKTMDAYGAAKARLFEMLPATGAAVVNADDASAARMVNGCKAPVYGSSLEGNSASWPAMSATVRRATRWGTEATFTGPWGSVDVSLPFVGPHNLMNALQAAGVVWALAQRAGPKADLTGASLDMPGIVAALAKTALPPGRLQCLTGPRDGVTVYVDYAHTDDALRTVLSVFRGIVAPGTGRIIVVFGCGGDRDATKRPRMGAVAAELADRIYVTSDNPRTEDPRSIIDAIMGGMPTSAWPRVTIEPERERAIGAAIAEAKDGDVVIIAGKGHEDYQILPDPAQPLAAGGHARKTIKRFFDDRLVAQEALAARGIRVEDPRPRIVVRHPAPGSPQHTSHHPPSAARAAAPAAPRTTP